MINSAGYTNSSISTRYLPAVLIFMYCIYYFAGVLLNHNASKFPMDVCSNGGVQGYTYATMFSVL